MWALANQIFDNETMYSWLSRYVITSTMPSNTETLTRMNISRHAEFTAHIPGFIASVAEYCQEKPETLLYKHSTLNFFRPFLDPARFERIVSEALNGRCDTRFSRLGQSFSAKEPLRFCPACVHEQLAAHGISYWLVQHQYPGQFACIKHNKLLVEKPVNRREFCWPEPVIDFELADTSSILANWIEGVNALSYLKKDLFFDAMKIGFARHNLITSSGRVKAEQVKLLMNAKWSHMTLGWIKQLVTDTNYPQQMFYNIQHYHHPLKLILLAATVFEDWTDFLNSYAVVVNGEVTVEVLVEAKRRPQAQISKGVAGSSAVSSSLSLKQLASKWNVSVTMAKNRKVQLGMAISRRPQFLFMPEVERIIKQLDAGYKTEDIARSFACSKSAIEQILAQNPELKAKRHQLRFQERQSRHRQIIFDAAKLPNMQRRVDIQTNYRASYTWLYKHDREWLYETIPQEIPRANRVH